MRSVSLLSVSSICTLFVSLLSFHIEPSLAETRWITYTTEDGEKLYLDDNREPALYTRDYGDCQGDSIIQVDRFDAAYYKDNMTISFHLGGSTLVANESVIMYIGVYAYGENRFNLTFDPCFANIRSMCPVNSSVPIEANGLIPIAPVDVAAIPELALSIPDFEGQAILRIFGNSTQSQVACYSAVLTNGNTFSHPAAVGSTVGIFVITAFIASVATAIYGQGLQETRKHYAHSVSMFVVFSVLQHVFYTGALSMNFPSVLVAFWSNFGWASGMIYSKAMQDTINDFVGNDPGNVTSLGAALAGQTAQNLGGGYSISQIYRRGIELLPAIQDHALHRRALIDSSTGFSWYGHSVEPGLPLPGNYSSFAGTLAPLQIPASNAFLTGFLWFLILVAILIGIVVGMKVVVELLAAVKIIKTNRFRFFRAHWIYCAGIFVLRASYIGFFMMTFLSLFQFTIGGGTGALAVAGTVFCVFLLGMFSISAWALWNRLSSQSFHNNPDKLVLKRKSAGRVLWYGWTRETTAQRSEDTRHSVLSLPWRHLHFHDSLGRPHVHDDGEYMIKFGWLYARFRRSKWWFFAAWLVYELGRSCFYGAAAGSPMIQVFGLLAWEILCFFVIVIMRPFESNRLNMLMVYFLGFSKIASVALCSAFDPRFGVGRILTTVIGITIIVIQGVLIICMLCAIVVGAISSYMSIHRFGESFRPKGLANTRSKYFAHIEQKATDKPQAKPVAAQQSEVQEPKEPYFSVTTVRRETKIEEEEEEEEEEDPEAEICHEDKDEDVRTSVDIHQRSQTRQASKAPSMRSRNSISNLPYGARRHRASWSTRDFSNTGCESENISSEMHSRMSIDSIGDAPQCRRASSVRQSCTDNPSLVNVANAAVDGHSPYRSRHSKSRSMSQAQTQAAHAHIDEQYIQRPATQAD